MIQTRHVPGLRWLWGAAFPLACFMILLLPTIASAHALLVRSDPAADAVLASAPSQVHMWFSEDLNPTFSTAYVVNAATSNASTVNDTKTHVDTGDVHLSSSNSKEMDLSLKPNLPGAVYAVFYRTQSAEDGHILYGSFLFTVKDANGNTPTFNGTLPGESFGNGSTTTGQLDGPTLFSLIMITLVDLGVIFWMGAQLWVTFVLQLVQTDQPDEQAVYEATQRRFERVYSVPTLVLILLANVGVLIGQALSVTGGNLGQALAPSILFGLVSHGQFGTYWIMREIVVVLALAIAAYLIFSQKRQRAINDVLSWANLVLGLALLMAVTFSGHAAAVTSIPPTYSILVDWLHLLAASLWIGGMTYLARVYLPVINKKPLEEQARLLLKILPRYSPLAMVGVIIMAISGPFNAVVHIGSLDQLFNTAYGRALIVKVALVGSVMLTSAYHVGLLRPRLAKDEKKYREALEAVQQRQVEEPERLPDFTAEQVKQLERRVTSQTSRLTTVLRWEPLLGIAIVLCTGLMAVFAGTLQPAAVNQSPTTQPAQTVAKPFQANLKTSDNQFSLQFNVSPNTLGTNVFTVHVLDSKGVTATNVGVSVYTTMLDMDMGTDHVNLKLDGKGNFSGSGDLDMAGNWQVRIDVRTLDGGTHSVIVKFVSNF